VILGFFGTLRMSPRRLGRTAVILKTATLHRALVKRKYRLLYTSETAIVAPDPMALPES
jgi:hypothetical protein